MKVIPAKDFKEEPPTIKKFAVGGCWEESEWEINLNETITLHEPYRPLCPHMGEPFEVEHVRGDGSTYRNKHVVCPRVVVGTNEGGYSSTGICLDCILEAAKTL